MESLWNSLTSSCISVTSTESDVNICTGKVWIVIDRLLTIWKSEISDKIKQEFFQAVIMPVLLYGCTTWILMKCLEEKFDGS